MLKFPNGSQQANCLQRQHANKGAADSVSGNYVNELLTNDELSDNSKKPEAQKARLFAELCALAEIDSTDPAYLCHQKLIPSLEGNQAEK